MKKIMDKLYSKIKLNKKILVFLTIISLTALITGSLFVVFLDKSDKTLTTNYLNELISSITNSKIDYFSILTNSFISNALIIVSIWLLGISIIGIPIIIYLYFSQIFTIGFAIGSIILKYGYKGLVLSFLYLFPHNFLVIIYLIILVSYAISLSIKLIGAITKKKQLDFKNISNKYLLILGICLLLSILSTLYETFGFTYLIKLIYRIIK